MSEVPETQQGQQEQEVTLSSVTFPVNIVQSIYQYLSSKPSGETRQLLNVMDNVIHDAVQELKNKSE